MNRGVETRDRPVRSADRIVVLDVLRGIAVFGILFANLPFMALAGVLADQTGRFVGAGPLDAIAKQVVLFVVDTKFITLFSFLFGAGLALMAEKATARGAPFARIYRRRLVALVAFGVAHATLIWFGDVLVHYALLGFVAMLFRGCRVRTLLWWAGGLLLLNGLMWIGIGMLDPADFVEPRLGADGQPMDAAAQVAEVAAKYSEVFASGDFARMVAARTPLWLQTCASTFFFMFLRTSALFLLGMAAVKGGLFQSPLAARRLLVAGLAIGLPLQIACNATTAIEPWGAWQLGTLYGAGLALAAAYLGFVLRWSASAPARGLHARLAAVGRMAFTNYIGQSVLAGLLFNYVGLFDRLDRATLLPIALAICAFQLWFSTAWLRRFQMGPLESLWRRLTYGPGDSVTPRG